MKEEITTAQPNVVATSSVTEVVRKSIRENLSGDFQFNANSLRSILIGGSLINPDSSFDTKLFVDLTLISLDAKTDIINLSRGKVRIIQKWIEARLTHCEWERAQEAYAETGAIVSEEVSKPRFNQDTYISMKLLLLDIREWLMGKETLKSLHGATAD